MNTTMSALKSALDNFERIAEEQLARNLVNEILAGILQKNYQLNYFETGDERRLFTIAFKVNNCEYFWVIRASGVITQTINFDDNFKIVSDEDIVKLFG